MQRLFIALAGFALLTSAACGQEDPAGVSPVKLQLETTKDQASYALGVQIGRSIKSDGLEINADAVAQAIIDVFDGRALQLTDEKCEAALAVFQRELTSRQQEQMRVEGEKNSREGQAFLAANGKKEGVVTLPSGLQYKVVKGGTGESPKLTDKVRVHYHGTLLDGTVFDSSVQRGQPLALSVGGVIRGWTEALQLMKVGGKWQLFIPSDLAYGPNPRPGGPIGPHATLIFDVELLGID